MCRTDRAGSGCARRRPTDSYHVTALSGRLASPHRRLAFCYLLVPLRDSVEPARQGRACTRGERRHPVADCGCSSTWPASSRDTGPDDAAHARPPSRARSVSEKSAVFLRTGPAAASWISGRAPEIVCRLTDELASMTCARRCDDLEIAAQPAVSAEQLPERHAADSIDYSGGFRRDLLSRTR